MRTEPNLSDVLANRYVSFRSARAAGLCALALTGGVLAGCSNKTEGERTLERAEQVEDAGKMMTRGEQMVRDGSAMEARGRAAKTQGDSTEGERMINEGQAMQRQGRVLVDQGRKARS